VTAIIDGPPLLTRNTVARDVAPIRIVHIGLGAFHKAHQAWYTDVVDERNEWGIAAFTGRTPTAAEIVSAQDGLYTVIERGPERDSARVIGSIVEAIDGSDTARLTQLLSSPRTAIVTITITEAGYLLNPDGSPILTDEALRADLESLSRTDRQSSTPICRIIDGLAARRANGGGPLAIVPCDNMPQNGAMLRTGVLSLAEWWGPELRAWIAENVSFVSTSVDRITPRTTESDLASAEALTGFSDRAAVVTEPFHDWVLCGAFPAGRPSWETAGARFVDEIEPFEKRKLWLLNGSHSLLAYAGRLRGHATVSEAASDPVCREWMTDFWNEAAHHLPAELDVPMYCRSLLDRYANSRIEHRLEQIGQDASTKLGVRIVPVILAERLAGRTAEAGVRVLASWIALLISGANPPDSKHHAIRTALDLESREETAEALLRLVHPDLLTDKALCAEVFRSMSEILRPPLQAQAVPES
jgi:fructuronate reductase